MTPRKLTIQLASLLDLMLIVIFAQYVEMWETEATRDRQRAQQAAAEREALLAEQSRARAELKAERNALEQSRAEFEARRDEQAQREADLNASLEHALEQQRQIGDLVAELYQVPDALVEELVSERRFDPRHSEAENEQLRQSFRELSALRGTAALKHLLTFQELRKRCDVWEIYISADGLVTLNAGTGEKHFRFRDAVPEDDGTRTRAQIRAEDEAAAERFADRLFDLYKTLPESKSVVIMLLSYSKTTSYNWRRPAILGLSKAADRMRTDTHGRTRFEYALIGPVDLPPTSSPSPSES